AASRGRRLIGAPPAPPRAHEAPRRQRGRRSVGLRGARIVVAGAVAALLLARAAHADVAPGDRITEANVEQVKELISPGLEWCIRHGVPRTVGGSRRIERSEEH